MATIKDVAQKCGVSAMTVSYVFNGKVGAVSAATRERVLQAARELNYQPNRFARSLKGRTGTIGMVIADLRNPFYVEMLEAAERVAAESGYQVLTETQNGPTGKFTGWPVDGFLMWAQPEQSLEAFLGPLGVSPGVPVVYWGDVRREDGSDIVGLDLYAASRPAAEYAARRGYKRWALVYPQYEANFRFEPRFCAWDEVCREKSLRLETLWPRHAQHSENIRENCRAIGIELAARPSARRPTLVACTSDLAAIAVIHGLRRGGLRVPEDVAVIGFDGIEEGQMLDRALTTVQVPKDEMCRRALEILRARINGEALETQRVVMPATLLEGETA